MSTSRQVTGKLGEDLAAEYLVKKGYTLLEKNFRTRSGEIDLVAMQNPGGVDQVLVFVEVKTRRSTSYGYPEESVTWQKQAHMQAAARLYLSKHAHWTGDWRFDVLAVQLSGSDRQKAEIEHFENVIS